MHYGLLTTEFEISLIQALVSLGRSAEAGGKMDQAICTVEARGDLVYLPELLRVKAALLSDDDADRCLRQSLQVSRRQGARSWELRTATDLAARLNTRNRTGDALTVLQPVFEQFTEGRGTADLERASRLLEILKLHTV